MSLTTLGAWLEDREPPAPPAFRPHLLARGGMGTPTALGGGARREAVSRPGRDREAAFALLAGDALMTYACEASAEEEGNVGEALEAILQLLGTRFP
jgi:hypothetical protein